MKRFVICLAANGIVNNYNSDRPRDLMIQCSIVYSGGDTNEYVLET